MKKVSIQKIDSVIRRGETVSGLIRLAKNGRFASFNGKIKERKRASDGHFYVVAENTEAPKRQDGKRWQSIRLANIITLS